MNRFMRVTVAATAAAALFTGTAFAREPEQIESTVTYTEDDSYFINIPSTIQVGSDCTVSAYDVNIAPGKTVKIKLGNLWYNEGIQLTSVNDPTSTMCVKFYDADGTVFTESNNLVSSFTTLRNETQSTTIRAEVDGKDENVVAGEYTGTVNFDIICE